MVDSWKEGIMQERRLRGQVMAGVRRVVAYGSPAAMAIIFQLID